MFAHRRACASTSRQPASLILSSLSVLLLSPAIAHAQGALEVRARVVAAAMNPRGDIADAPILDAEVNVIDYDDLEVQPEFGLGLELRPAGLPVGLRLGASHAFGREAVGRWGCVPGVGCPAILIEVPTDVTTTVFAADAVADVPTGSPVRLHPTLGVAWVRYGYEWDPAPVGSFSLEPGSHSEGSTALRLGAGASVPAGPVRLEVGYVEHILRSGPPRPTRAGAFHAGVSVPLR
jgi:hypothetical protein